MEKILARLRSENDEFQGVFSPEQTAMMKRVFVQVCHDAGIPADDQDRRDTLALVILRATKGNTTEIKLLAVARKTAKAF